MTYLIEKVSKSLTSKIGELLISKGADMNDEKNLHYNKEIRNTIWKFAKKNDSCLFNAILAYSTEMVELLISNGANVNAKNSNIFIHYNYLKSLKEMKQKEHYTSSLCNISWYEERLNRDRRIINSKWSRYKCN